MPFQIEPQDESRIFDLLYSQRLRSGTDTINQNFSIFRAVTQGFRSSLDYLHFFSLIAGTSLSEVILANLDKRILPYIYYILAPTLDQAESLKENNIFTPATFMQPSSPSKGDILFLFSQDSPSDFSVYICVNVQQLSNSGVQYTWEELSSGIGGGGIKTLKSYEDFLKEYKKVKNAGRLFYLNFDTSTLPSSWITGTQTDTYIPEVIKLKDLIKRGDAVLFYYDQPIPQNPQNPIYLKVRVLNRLGESPVLNPEADIPDTYNNVISFEKGMDLEQMAMAIDEFAEKLAPPKPPVFTDKRISVESRYGSPFNDYGYEPNQANGCVLLSNPNYYFDAFNIINNFPAPNKKSLIIYGGSNLNSLRQNNHLFNFVIRLGSFINNRYYGFELDEKSSLFVRFVQQGDSTPILKRHNFQIVTKDELLNTIFNRFNPSVIDDSINNFIEDQNNSQYNSDILSSVILSRNIRDAYFSDGRSFYQYDSKSVRFWAQAVLYLDYQIKQNQSNSSPYFIYHAVARTRISLNQDFISQRSIEIYFDYENVVSSDNVADFVFYIGSNLSNLQTFITATDNNLSISDYTFNSNTSPVSFFYVSGLPYIDLDNNSFIIEIQRVREVCGRYAIRRNFLDISVYFSISSTYNVIYNPSYYQKENSSYDIVQANSSSPYRENISNNFRSCSTSLWINSITLNPIIEAYYFYLYRKNLQLTPLSDQRQYRVIFSQNSQSLILYSSIIKTANIRETTPYDSNVRRIVDLITYLNRLESQGSVLFEQSDQNNSSFRQQSSLQLISFASSDSYYLRYVYPFRNWNLALSIEDDNYDYTGFTSHRFVGYRLRPISNGSSSAFVFNLRHSLSSNNSPSENSLQLSDNFVIVVRPSGAHPSIDGLFFILTNQGGTFSAPSSSQFQTTSSVSIQLSSYQTLSNSTIARIEISFKDNSTNDVLNMFFNNDTYFDIFVGFNSPLTYKSLNFDLSSNSSSYYPVYPSS